MLPVGSSKPLSATPHKLHLALSWDSGHHTLIPAPSRALVHPPPPPRALPSGLQRTGTLAPCKLPWQKVLSCVEGRKQAWSQVSPASHRAPFCQGKGHILSVPALLDAGSSSLPHLALGPAGTASRSAASHPLSLFWGALPGVQEAPILNVLPRGPECRGPWEVQSW